MLDKIYNINAYLYEGLESDNIVFYQNDTEQSGIEVNFFSEYNVPFDISAATVTCLVAKSDGTQVIEYVTIDESTNNKASVIFHSNTLAAPGKNTLYIIVYGTNGEKQTFGSLKFQVRKDVENGSVVSTTEYPVLTSLITDVNGLKTSLETDFNEINTELEENVVAANLSNSQLQAALLNSQSAIDKIESSEAYNRTILTSEWIYNSSLGKYEFNIGDHNLASRNLIVTITTSDGSSVVEDFKIIDMNNIVIYNEDTSELRVTLVARYYKNTGGQDIADEVVLARGVFTDLDGRFNGIDLQLADILKEKSTEVNINKFKTTTNTWQNAFDGAISYITTNFTSGVIRVGIGTFEVAQINLPASISLIGDSPTNTIIKSIAGNNVDFLVTINGYYGDLKNLTIDGNRANSTVGGLGYLNTCTERIIDNIHIKNCNKNALEIKMPSYNNKTKNIVIYDCDNNGLVCYGTDQFFGKNIVKRVKGNGFVVYGGNNMFELCKAYYTGVSGDNTKGDGFMIYGETTLPHTNRFICCEAQECGRHGFYLYKAKGCQLISCEADSCSMYSQDGIGIKLESSYNNFVTGVVSNKDYLNANAYIRIAIQIINGVFNDINVKTLELYTTTNNKPFLKLVDTNNANGINKIFVNGFREGILSSFNKDSRLYLGAGGVADGFEIRSVTPGNVYNVYLSDVERCQAINVSSGTPGTNVQVCTYFDLNNIKEIGYRVDAKTNNVNNSYKVQFTFLDSGDATISSLNYPDISETILQDRFVTLYKYQIPVPINAVKVRVSLLNSLVTNSVGTVFYKNFEFYKLSN